MSEQHEGETSSVTRLTAGRAQIEIVVDAATEHNFWCDLAFNVRSGGVFVATHEPLRLGTVVDLSLRLPDAEEPVVLSGVVRWTRAYVEDSDGPAGLGIKFLEVDDGVGDRLARFVQIVRDPILFELDEVPMRSRPSRPKGALTRVA